jgi:hypothetical protein
VDIDKPIHVAATSKNVFIARLIIFFCNVLRGKKVPAGACDNIIYLQMALYKYLESGTNIKKSTFHASSIT